MGQDRPAVLVIDDDPDIRLSVAMFMEIEGLPTDTVSDGQKALDYLRKNPPPGVILLDLVMPGMNGWDFLVAQRNDANLSSIPVLIYSGVSPLKDLSPFPAVREIFVKPVDPKNLVIRVREYCGLLPRPEERS